MKPSQKYKNFEHRRFYNIRSLIGNDWAMFYFLLGGRAAGKSYATLRFFIDQWKKKKRPFYWLRLTETAAKNLLRNNAAEFVDADIRRDFNLDLITKGNCVYEVERDEKGNITKKELMCHILSLSTFYNNKGQALYDKDFLNDPNMYYNICLDEMNKEECEKRTQDILYSFANQVHNIIRNEKNRVRIICIGNLLKDASDLLVGINFIPHEFGRYKIRKLRTIIDYIPPTEAYLEEFKGSAGDLLSANASTFTNKAQVEVLDAQIHRGKLEKPHTIIKFDADKTKWFTIWDSDILAPYNGEKCHQVIAMVPYKTGEMYIPEMMRNIIERYQLSRFRYRNLLTERKFKNEIMLLKPRG